MMNVHSEWPEWVVRQDFACVHVQAPSAAAAVEASATRLQNAGDWKVGPDVDQEVFPAREYRKHARLGDYTRSVIIASRPSGGFIRTETDTAARRDEPKSRGSRSPRVRDKLHSAH